MRSWIAAAIVAAALVACRPGAGRSGRGSAAEDANRRHVAMRPISARIAITGVTIAITACPHYQPYYYGRPVYYRPYPYQTPAPFTFGIGFGPSWW